MTVHGEPLAYYFAHVDDVTEDCIIWPYATSRGYGQLWIDGRLQGVHVLACERRHGPCPPGLEALHLPVICHIRACFNGRHLRWGTRSENMQDAILDGTVVITGPGERNGNAKRTWEQVTEIRTRYAMGGISQRALAAEYGTTVSCINRIINQKAWRTPSE